MEGTDLCCPSWVTSRHLAGRSEENPE